MLCEAESGPPVLRTTAAARAAVRWRRSCLPNHLAIVAARVQFDRLFESGWLRPDGNSIEKAYTLLED